MTKGPHICDYLVVDSGGFLRNAPLRDLARSEIYSISEVVDEIRDKATRSRLAVLPYTLNFRNPSQEALQKIKDFSQKSGDYGSLSATDIKVLALTYDLEKEVNNGHIDHIKIEPQINKTTSYYKPGGQNDSNQETSTNGYKNEKIAGFYQGDDDDDDDKEETTNNLSDKIDNLVLKENDDQIVNETTHREKVEISISKDSLSQNNKNNNEFNTAKNLNPDSDSTSNGEKTEEEDLDITDDDDEWITPSNLQDKRKAMMGVNNNDEPQFVKVACMTTDFAMQNVLKLMGLSVVSVDGLLIQETKTWILRCYSCYKTTHLMHKQFCPKCGNKTLKRVSVTVNDDGSQQIHISTRKALTGRGKKFSLPKPVGGKHAVNPILCEDQTFAQQRRTKLAQDKTNVMHPDYLAGNSPFSLHDVTSKSAVLGTPGVGIMNNMYWMKKNPNASGKSTGNRKKKNRK